MLDKKNDGPLVMLSGCWPGASKGYELAVDSDLKSVSKLFDKIYFLGPIDEFFDDGLKVKYPNVEFIKMPFTRDSQLWRFACTIFSNTPATSYRYSRAIKEITSFLTKKFDLDSKFYVFYQDIPISIVKAKISSLYKNSFHIVRSHNVVYTGFKSLLKSYDTLKKIAWRIELFKIKGHELSIMKSCDISIAISSDDAIEYKRLGVNTNYVLPVYIDPSKYLNCPNGDYNKLINIGTADLRKGSALLKFIQGPWMNIRQNNVALKSFTIAGKGTEKFNNETINVTGVGPVDDDMDLLSIGKFFVNPQTDGSGIKIKSIIAMMSKKVLLSTDIGVEGMGLVDGVHYINISNDNCISSKLNELLSDKSKIEKISENGQQFVVNKFGNVDSIDNVIFSIFNFNDV
ncbi:conserved hypothetical protein [Vibrio chagasii]|nr:conserved hypothetical protein [Vibrio chagasii]CAH7177096.1 conserved hypothetical protein [Vibrio chagasii]CAH7243761.1 conserved hypothetical protein [Vibrio chagasii]CAH7377055.1 conserved hypothetical protein [Vibrio chagasii]